MVFATDWTWSLKTDVIHARAIRVAFTSGWAKQICAISKALISGAPGFIDLHVSHGAMGRDNDARQPKPLRTICDYHCEAAGGTTSRFLTTCATAPDQSLVKVLNEVRTAKSSIKQVGGVQLKGPFHFKANAGGQLASLIRNLDSKNVPLILCLSTSNVIKR